jgi:5-formyltetrahydrofolate cyclo-ligase
MRLLTEKKSDSAEALEAAGKRLAARLVAALQHQTGVWAAYLPDGFEPDIRSIFSQLSKITWAFPVIYNDSLIFLQSLSTPLSLTSDELESSGAFKPNKWGILEPNPTQSRQVLSTELRGLLIPGLAFDSRCCRLGRGKGFYDRALAEIHQVNKEVIKLGIAHDRQIVEHDLPADSHDIPMDWVLTESRCFDRDNRTGALAAEAIRAQGGAGGGLDCDSRLADKLSGRKSS